jgi:NDP-4-keto-2,6-dideoxyhexose 3-C-methyltransferase
LRRREAAAGPKVITSFSMFYDLEDPTRFMREIEACLDDEGVWMFEQSYLPAMLRVTLSWLRNQLETFDLIL